MLCLFQKCTCVDGYRLIQDPKTLKVKCLKATSGAELRYPQNCEIPYCEIVIYIFVFEIPNSSPSQRLASFTVVTDNHHYISEYYQLYIEEERLKFFIDHQETLRLILDGKFYAMYRELAQKEGYLFRFSRDVSASESEKEPILIRKPRLPKSINTSASHKSV